MKKILFILALFLVLPCVLIFAGCGKNETSKSILKMEVANATTQSQQLSNTYYYGDNLAFTQEDLKLYLVYSDGMQDELTLDRNSKLIIKLIYLDGDTA